MTGRTPRLRFSVEKARRKQMHALANGDVCCEHQSRKKHYLILHGHGAVVALNNFKNHPTTRRKSSKLVRRNIATEAKGNCEK